MNDERVWTSYVRGLKLQRRSPETLENYEVTFRHLQAYLSGKPVVEADRSDLEGFFEHRLALVAASTVHGNYVNLRPFFNWLVAEEYISRSPMVKIPAPEFEYKTPRVLSDDELVKLFKACRGPRIFDKRDEAMLRLMSEVGGPRRAEIVGMKLSDVDFNHDTVRLEGKTGIRTIPFGAKTGYALDRYLRLRDKSRHCELPNLWLSQKGRVFMQTPWWVIQKRSELAGIGKMHPHTLRHTAAHRALMAGMSEADMETLFGWTPGSAMTRIYGRATRVIRAQGAARRLDLGNL